MKSFDIQIVPNIKKVNIKDEKKKDKPIKKSQDVKKEKPIKK